MTNFLESLKGRFVGVDDNPEYNQHVASASLEKLKTCLICGKPFIKNRRGVYCGRQHYTTCLNCGKRIDILPKHYYALAPKTCCKACADLVGTQTYKDNCLEKYGVTNPMFIQEYADKAFTNAHPDLDLSMRKMIETRNCEICGKSFEVFRTDPKRCCSTECSKKLRDQNTKVKTVICKVCGKEFSTKYANVSICSDSCKRQYKKPSHKLKPKALIAKVSAPKVTTPVIKSKICVLCGNSFIPASNAQTVCTNTHYRKCEMCGTEFVITRPSNSQLCCSKACTVKKREATTKSRYGVEHALQNSGILKKAQQTTFERYGVKHAAQSNEVKQKIAQTCKDKYGVPTPFLMDDFNDKARETTIQRYGTDHVIASTISKTNKAIAEDITRLTGLQCELDKIKLDRFSYDIHIIGTNILLEIDPTYTHNTVGNHWHHSGIPFNYHQAKTNAAVANGYRCIHIFDWDDLDKVIQLLAPKKKVYARKCEVRKVSTTAATVFETDNHLQNSCRGQSVRLGLYHDGELVQLMTFGKPRYNKQCSWELLRLCTRADIIVVGGAERLFSSFVQTNSPDSIISYCDLAKFTGDVYARIGFTLSYTTQPNKIWSKRKQMITNNLLVARGYDQLFGTTYGKGTSNEQLMLDHGWYPVYDCGQAVYVWTSDSQLSQIPPND